MDDDFAPQSGQLIRLTVTAPEPDLEVIAALLFEAGAGGLVEEEGSLVVYTEGRKQLADFRATLHGYRNGKDDSSKSAIRWSLDLPNSDWQKTWQRALGPERVSPTFTLRPTHCPRGPSDENTLWFAPAASFGSGQHPTTRLMATAVEEWVTSRPGASFLDVGTGTGVLAFIAARVGAGQIVGVDTDEIAAKSAMENARLNDLSERVQIKNCGASSLSESFDLVAANINTHILLPEAAAIAARVAPLGTLLLTGLLDEDVKDVTSAYEAHGLALSPQKSMQGWSLLCGEREAK